MLLLKKHFNIIDIVLKLLIIFAIFLSFWYIPIITVIYEYNGNDRSIDIEYYRVEYEYNFFGYKIENVTTHEDYYTIDVINEDFIQPDLISFLVIIVYGFIPLVLIVNVWKYPRIKYKELIILAMIAFSIFIIIFSINNYFSTAQNKIKIIRSYYFSEPSTHYGDKIEIKFASEFPILPVTQILIILIGSIIYDKFIKKHTIIIPSNSFLISFIKKVIIMEEAKLWDFKKTLEMWHVKEKDKKKERQVKFCEDFISFANSKGGLLIIGISDKIPRKFYTIKDLEINKQRIASAIRRWTDFKKEYYFLKEVNITYQNEEKTCLILLISQTKTPIGVRQIDGISYKYPYRTETGKEWMTYREISQIKKGISSNNTNFINELKKIIR